MKILAVSFAYPPLAYPRSIQVARLLKYSGIDTVLFCADEPGARRDATIEPEAESFLDDCIRVPVKESLISWSVDRAAYKLARGLWNRRNLAPDKYTPWKSDVMAAVLEYSRKRRYEPDVIVTFAQPFTDHLIGLELKALTKRPWIAHFSDPWVDNPFSPFDERTRIINETLERSVAEKADRLVFTSEETVDLFYQKYPARLREKASVLPQCFDAGRYGNEIAGLDDAITIRYLGNFYGNRRPTSLTLGLHELARTSPSTLENVVIELIGSGDSKEVADLSQGLPDGLVSTRQSINYSESLRWMKHSDGLLIIDAPAELSVFLPSKLVDYIGAGRPIFGITPPGAAFSLICELGGTIANPGDIGQVAGKLREFIVYLKKRRSSGAANTVWGQAATRERYRAEIVAGEFRELVGELAGRN